MTKATGSYWKDGERKVGKALGVQRNSKTALGDRSGVCDVETKRLSIEVKCRAEIPKWFSEPLKQAKRNAREGRVPVVVWHPKGGFHVDDLVVLRFEDFISMIGEETPVCQAGEGSEQASDGGQTADAD